jgi:hypothetical protein
MKGLNPLVGHTMTILFSILLIVVVITALNSITQENQKFLGENEMIVVCSTIRSAVEELNLNGDYVSLTDYTSTKTINLPERVAGFNYKASFVNSTLKIETQSTPSFNQTCGMGFNMTYRGSSNGGKTRIDLTSKTDGSREVVLSRG